MASNKDKAFALFYTTAAVPAATVTVTAATAIIVVIPTNQPSTQATNQPIN